MPIGSCRSRFLSRELVACGYDADVCSDAHEHLACVSFRPVGTCAVNISLGTIRQRHEGRLRDERTLADSHQARTASFSQNETCEKPCFFKKSSNFAFSVWAFTNIPCLEMDA